MNRIFILAGVLASLLAFGCGKQSADNKTAGTAAQETTKPPEALYKAFGDSVQSTSPPLALADAVRSPSTTNVVRVMAKVTEVCQKRGCWLMLTDGSSMVRVNFKDDGFFVPKDIAGKTIIAEGLVTEEIIPESDARHHAEDAGKSKAEIEKIKGNQKRITMLAQSVFLPVN